MSAYRQRCHFIFDYNSRVSWSIFISYIPLETGMNTLRLYGVYEIGLAALYDYNLYILCLLNTHISDFTAGVREFSEFEPYNSAVLLLAMTRSNTLNITVNHRLISRGATFRCCQMRWLLVCVIICCPCYIRFNAFMFIIRTVKCLILHAVYVCQVYLLIVASVVVTAAAVVIWCTRCCQPHGVTIVNYAIHGQLLTAFTDWSLGKDPSACVI